MVCAPIKNNNNKNLSCDNLRTQKIICQQKEKIKMPTKHIDPETWEKIEKITVNEVIKTKKSVKDTEMLKRLILLGIKAFEEKAK